LASLFPWAIGIARAILPEAPAILAQRLLAHNGIRKVGDAKLRIFPAMPPVKKKFQATIYKIWMMRHVDVPADVAAAMIAQLRGVQSKPSINKTKTPRPKYIPVVAIVNGRTARVTLMPAGGGRYRIQLNTALRKAARADVGSMVSVELRLDRASRELPVPADLRLALKENPAARHAFEELTTGHRRHFIKWFDSAKAPDTRIRRLGRAIDVLLQRSLRTRSKRKPASARRN
jgi:Bacteriocin-protection, YdeI or OmpD-Associated/Domain of unknown function (DUF1905)